MRSLTTFARVGKARDARALALILGIRYVLPHMRTFVLLLALLPLVTGCKKELGDLCSDGSECETEICRDVPPGSSVTKICAADPPCPDDAINIGECLRPCSEGCAEGTICDPVFKGCVAACTGEGQCRNNTCTLATGLCE